MRGPEPGFGAAMRVRRVLGETLVLNMDGTRRALIRGGIFSCGVRELEKMFCCFAC